MHLVAGDSAIQSRNVRRGHVDSLVIAGRHSESMRLLVVIVKYLGEVK